MKTLERMIDIHIRENTEKQHLSDAQHAYRKGRSTETALHEVVCHIEKSLHFNQYTMATFLDIEAQGGVLSPLLWLINMNDILRELNSGGVKVVAYADDVVLLVSGPFPDGISNIMTGALNRLNEWAKTCGLGINPSETELMLFTRRTKIPTYSKPKIDGIELELSDKAKYLGVILDPKLSWKLNITERDTAAQSAARLKASNCWKGYHTGHCRILEDNNYLAKNKTDYMTAEIRFGNGFTTTFPTREDWENDRVTGQDEVSLYTDGSKMDCGVGAGIFAESWGIESKFHLPESATVFQAEVLAILEAAKLSIQQCLRNTKVRIYSDSQAAIKSLAAARTNSTLVADCKSALNILATNNHVQITWVPGHNDIPGNEKADELARKGSADDSYTTSLPESLNTVQARIHEHYKTLAGTEENAETTIYEGVDQNGAQLYLEALREDLTTSTYLPT
ncbi:uncharacterized protein [Drosophila takahashii]|uniref:uncharacterized protein n=1 Tax=Drosophila takahashii TaxID=29030 RepID=UPI0038996A24